MLVEVCSRRYIKSLRSAENNLGASFSRTTCGTPVSVRAASLQNALDDVTRKRYPTAASFKAWICQTS